MMLMLMMTLFCVGEERGSRWWLRSGAWKYLAVFCQQVCLQPAHCTVYVTCWRHATQQMP